MNSARFVDHCIISVRKMAEFLIDTQIMLEGAQNTGSLSAESNSDAGGWPLIRGKRASTMATGHAVGALQLALVAFRRDNVLEPKIRKAIENGVQWLEENQNKDGGWGSEPSAGTDGKESRIVATYYALYGFWYRGGDYQNSKVVRDAVGFLEKVRNQDGSWGFSKGWKETFLIPVGRLQH
ncbi:MAG: hypothetical protein IPO91_03480 [Chloroflexi bacterium]|nr:hypothetical protein [Chloroflexota bacterium]